MGGQGETLVDVAVKLGTCKETIRQWAQQYPDFLAALKHCRTKSEAAMMQMGKAGAVGKIKGFGQATWIFWMKARFGWRDDGANETDLPGDRPELEFTE